MSREWRIEGLVVPVFNFRQFIFARDRECLAAKFDRAHRCRGKWQRPHAPWDTEELTIEHVSTVHSVSDGRKDDNRHCVALCYDVNVERRESTDELREKIRQRLRDLYPTCRPDLDPPAPSGQH